MKKSSILICIILSSFISPPDRIAWKPDQRLQWSDFKGQPDALDGYVASTSSGMSQSYAIDGHGFLKKEETEVTAHFYPEFSWYRAKDTTYALLRHEQTHFDITEIHVRLLKDRIANFSFSSNSKVEIKALYDQVEKERRAMQALFDKETDHSRNKEVEIEWEQKIYLRLTQ